MGATLQTAVFLDDEEVSFEGALPGTPADLVAILSQHLCQQGRELAAFRADENECRNTPPASYSTIREIRAYSKETTAPDPAQAQALSELPAWLDAFATQCLSRPWSQTAEELGTLDERIQPLAQAARQQAQWQEAFQSCWGEMAEAASKGGIARFVHLLVTGLLPLARQIQLKHNTAEDAQ